MALGHYFTYAQGPTTNSIIPSSYLAIVYSIREVNIPKIPQDGNVDYLPHRDHKPAVFSSFASESKQTPKPEPQDQPPSSQLQTNPDRRIRFLEFHLQNVALNLRPSFCFKLAGRVVPSFDTHHVHVARTFYACKAFVVCVRRCTSGRCCHVSAC